MYDTFGRSNEGTVLHIVTYNTAMSGEHYDHWTVKCNQCTSNIGIGNYKPATYTTFRVCKHCLRNTPDSFFEEKGCEVDRDRAMVTIVSPKKYVEAIPEQSRTHKLIVGEV